MLLLLMLSASAATVDVGFFAVVKERGEARLILKDMRGQECFLGEDSGITVSDVESATMSEQFGELTVALTFTEVGGARNEAFTTKYHHQQIAMVIGDVVVSDPMVMSPSKRHTVISGSFTKAEVQEMVAKISGKLKAVRERIDP
jgi:preprotein translocase subunit SecD